MKLPKSKSPLGGRHHRPREHFDTFDRGKKKPSYDDLMAQLAKAINNRGSAPAVTVNIPKPKALNTKGTAVGGSARGVKSKRSEASKRGRRGTRSLNRKQRAARMKINNINI
tara:strand:+ start:44 stop:379 length:336 start_codon:yes stop_codon:yes gene_type:complete